MPNVLATLSLVAAVAVSIIHAAPLPSLSTVGCGGAGFRVAPSSQRLVDGCGRERLNRGINKVEKTPPYYPDPLIFSAGNSATPGDAALQQSLGWNAMRLGAMWAGVAPVRGGGVNTTYLDVLTGISRVFSAGAGVATLVDAHQDLLSEAFCADGAPIWLAHDMAAGAPQAFPLPVTAASCPFGPDGRPAGNCCGEVSGWADFYSTSAVSFAFQQLYTNRTFSDQFAAFWAAVAAAYLPLGGDALIGYEALNEPWAGDVLADPALLVPGVADRANLQPFYESVAAAIRRVAPKDGIVFYEGVTWDDVFPLGFAALPDAAAGLAAISYHYYDLPGLDFDLDIAQRQSDMERLQAGALLTEFAVYPDGFCPNSLDCLRRLLDTLERYSHGYLGWEYATVWANASALIEARVYELARPFPMVIAGHLQVFSFDRNSSRMTLNYTATAGAPAGLASTTVVYLSLGLYFPGGFSATVAVKPEDATVVIATPCWAGAGAGGSHVDPPGMGCAPAAPLLTPGAPPPYAYGYVELTLNSQMGGDVSLVIVGKTA